MNYRIIIVILLHFCISSLSYAQHRTTLYTGIINRVPDNFGYPLIGFINIAKGNHNSLQIGFININQKKLSGIQTGFVNVVGNDTKGLQIGFVNTTGGALSGIQTGFINTTKEQTKGAQIGFINRTKALKGLQLGFINTAAVADQGVPIGFLSFVGKGGYKAIELGITEMYPINISFKTGVKHFYNSFTVSYTPSVNYDFAIGAGIGSIFAISRSLFINPEITSMHTNLHQQQLLSLATYLGFDITPHIQVVAGPSIVWHHDIFNNELNKPYFSLAQFSINNKNQLIGGLRVAARYRL